MMQLFLVRNWKVQLASWYLGVKLSGSTLAIIKSRFNRVAVRSIPKRKSLDAPAFSKGLSVLVKTPA
jgi:hypothetical protein